MSNKICCKFHPEAALIEDYRAGDQICSACGLVVGDRVIDVGSEWRTFSSESGGEDKSRVGATENALLGSDLSTMIGPSPGGRGAGGSYSNMSSDAAIYTNRSRPQTTSTSDRALMDAFRTMSNMSDRINLPRTITDRANVLFKVVYEGRNLKGRSNSAISAACLYIACRQDGVPRTFKEIVAVSAVSKKEIGRVFKLILKAHDTNVELITTGDFMSRFCGTLSLARPIQKAATCIAQKAVDMDIVPGRSPISVTAAAIYMATQASRDKRTQKEIADIAGVADVTIRQSYKLMLTRAKELFPADFTFVTPIENLPQC
eukprot:TRINITY_DN8847_c0_g1_i1.p1 TRINITY_DN8847_c0_g1~~TRINITY_DN8847_c0_g1_i1.p1  ORF type:complete len:317 (-),score=51.23 TRINITY_DN8847_c0_g1_i1:90-1040(-)